jgi:CheY-like chemotaxis protein
VIALTANAMPRDVERGLAEGFIDYLTKPIDIGKLLTTVDRALEKYSGRIGTNGQAPEADS